jgi:hypothetical protein
MKKLGDLMKELGFNPTSAPGAQEAFLKNMIREAYGAEIPTHDSQHQRRSSEGKKKNEQLSFDLRDLIAVDELPPLKKKISG